MWSVRARASDSRCRRPRTRSAIWADIWLPWGCRHNGQPVWRARGGAARPLTYWAMRRVLQRANDKLGTNWTLHDARHTAATRMAGDDRLTLAEVQTILRHAHLDTTGRYLTARVEDLHDKLQEHYTRPRPQRTFAAGYDPDDIMAAWECRRHGLVLGARGAGSRFPGHLAWQVLHTLGHFPSRGPATLKAAVLNGRSTVAELVDRYQIRHAGVRQLLITYLERRKPELDYATLDNLARHLAGNFWATIEQLAPDQPDLRIDVGLYQRWRDQAGVRADGKDRRDFDPILRAVRAFYADLQAWAPAEPEQWAIWVATCPVSNADVRGYGIRRRRVKERMDDRTRQRQPLLATLVEHMENRYVHLRDLLEHAAAAVGGGTVTVDGRTFQRLWSRHDERRVRLAGRANVRVLDPDTGKRINVTLSEDAAFWEWAVVEVLRHSGMRIEEALELTHLSIRQYQRPGGEVIALLVVAPSKSD